ncbi:MAG: glycoside hydrolase [Bacteroidia bacterium]|nr:glycoside hydrolase [Bacteroidia bacterium]
MKCKPGVLILFSWLIIHGITDVNAQPSGISVCSSPLKGYIRRISGDTILYRSYRNDVKWAMLTRVTTGKMAIEWEAEALPASYSNNEVCYTWIAGYSSGTSSGNRTFDLYVNDEKWLSFTTIAKWKGKDWSIQGKNNSVLSFELKTKDHIDDVYGNMYLKIPAASLKPGVPLRLKVVGENAVSNDWYMTFMYRMEEKVKISPLPALTRKDGKEQQLIETDIDHINTSGKAMITLDKLINYYDLSFGLNRIEIPYPAVHSKVVIPVSVTIDGKLFSKTMITLSPVKIIRLYMIPHSHNDIGYSDLQDTVKKKQIRNIYDAMSLIRKSASYPPEARFKWNVEILWAVDKFMETASDKDKAEFITAVKNGDIQLNALYAGVLTGLCRPEEFYHLVSYALELNQKYGFHINTAMASDIPGFTWNIVPALAQSGIKYFTSGPNYMPGMPDGGDRVGKSNTAWGDKPFYWLSPSGKEKVLFWMAGKGYSWFHSWTLGRVGENIKTDLFAYINDLAASGYPYDMVQLRYTVDSDNGPVDPNLSDFVKNWNEKYISPEFVISTSSVMFENFEKKYGSTLPSFSGDLTPYWEDGALSVAAELAMNRQASERLVQAEILFSMTKPDKYDEARFNEAWKNVLLFDEHTFGAWNCVSDPDNPFVTEQWNYKRQFALNADSQSKDLLNEAASSGESLKISPSYEVINTNSWTRTDVVILNCNFSGSNIVVKDENHTEVPSQHLSDGKVAFLASYVPALGSKFFYISNQPPSARSGIDKIPDLVLSDGQIVAGIDSLTGAIRFLRYHGKNLVNLCDQSGLDEYLYVPGPDPDKKGSDNVNHISVKEDGSVLTTFYIRSEAPGCRSFDREITCYGGMGRLDIRNIVDKEKIRDKESVHFGFPFDLSAGKLRYDLGWATVRAGTDQLAGACQDFYCAQRWVDISDNTHGITMTVNESPLIEPDGITSEVRNNNGYRTWKTGFPTTSTVFSYAMNNYWHTNYKADQEGKAVFSYSLLPHDDFNNSQATRFGIERSQPFIVRRASQDNFIKSPLLTISVPDVIISSIKPVNSGRSLLVRLYNTGSHEVETKISSGQKIQLYLSDPTENKGKKIDIIKIPVSGIVTVLIEKE